MKNLILILLLIHVAHNAKARCDEKTTDKVLVETAKSLHKQFQAKKEPEIFLKLLECEEELYHRMEKVFSKISPKKDKCKTLPTETVLFDYYLENPSYFTCGVQEISELCGCDYKGHERLKVIENTDVGQLKRYEMSQPFDELQLISFTDEKEECKIHGDESDPKKKASEVPGEVRKICHAYKFPRVRQKVRNDLGILIKDLKKINPKKEVGSMNRMLAKCEEGPSSVSEAKYTASLKNLINDLGKIQNNECKK